MVSLYKPIMVIICYVPKLQFPCNMVCNNALKVEFYEINFNIKLSEVYLDIYRIVSRVSRYVSYRGISVSFHPTTILS